MKTMFLLFSHELSDDQINDAKEKLGVDEFHYLPERLQDMWSNIPPELDDILMYLDPIKEYIDFEHRKNDYILIQGFWSNI
jgi:hypothetical protein